MCGERDLWSDRCVDSGAKSEDVMSGFERLILLCLAAPLKLVMVHAFDQRTTIVSRSAALRSHSKTEARFSQLQITSANDRNTARRIPPRRNTEPNTESSCFRT